MSKFNRTKNVLHQWTHVFCNNLTCKKNLKRDAIIISVVIFLSILLIGMDFYWRNQKIQPTQMTDLGTTSVSPDQITSLSEPLIQDIPTAKAASDEQKTDEEINENKAAKEPLIVANEKPNPAPASPKKTVRETRSTGITCIQIPDHILVKLKNPPTPPDAKVKNGKRICHVLAEGKKDNPHKSSKNKRGGWGGCCYDPDEVPNPKCCYPVGSVYEKHLKKYFANPFPLRK